MVTMSEKAVSRVKELLSADPESKGKALRVSVNPGGCSGWEYAFQFDEKRDGDQAAAFDGFELIVDSKSLRFLENSRIDYFDEPTQSGFKIDNPNVKAACGCGHSFQF